jgi:curved DNA-binding protein CbpA
MTRPVDPGWDPYRVLQVDPEADDEIVQVVYRRLARMYHPDVTPGPAAAARMLEINAAMEILGDPIRREAYDRERAARAAAVLLERLAADPGRGAGPVAQGQPAAPGSPGRPTGTPGAGAARTAGGTPRPQTVSRDWTSGRSTEGGRYDPTRMRTADGEGAAGPPPGNPSGTVLNFGRYAGWSLGEIARRDLEYLEWLDRMAIGRAYRDEIDTILRKAGRRRSAPVDDDRRGLFRRR